MASAAWDLGHIITQEFPLDQFGQVIQTATDPDHALNVTIRF